MRRPSFVHVVKWADVRETSPTVACAIWDFVADTKDFKTESKFYELVNDVWSGKIQLSVEELIELVDRATVAGQFSADELSWGQDKLAQVLNNNGLKTH